jgi:hypothetical protein
MTKKARATGAPVPVCVEFVLDETGSMAQHLQASIDGFNEFLAEQAGDVSVTLTKFEAGKVKTPYEDIEAALVPRLTTKTFVPGGMTNLHDAIIERVNARKRKLQQGNYAPKVLLVVLTDGGDNMSRHSRSDVRELLMGLPENWTPLYLAAGQNAAEIGSQMGFHRGNTKTFVTTEIKQTMTSLGASTRAYTKDAALSTQTYFSDYGGHDASQ